MIKYLRSKVFFRLVNFLLNKKKEKHRFFSALHNLVVNFFSCLPTTKLSQLFFLTGTDKYTNYKFLYDNVLQGLISKKKVRRILELGIGGHSRDINSGKSLIAFSKFYKNAFVYGLDLADKKFLDSGKIKTLICDQGDKRSLIKLAKKNGPFDLIIDDGSHFTNHQKISFNSLFKYLNFGGVYIIEDIGTSYMKSYYGDPYLSKKNVVSYFSDLSHCVNDYQLIPDLHTKYKNYLDIDIIIFLKDAIVIKKNKSINKPFSKKKALQSLKEIDSLRTKKGIKIFK